MGRREEAFVRAVIDGASWREAARRSGLGEEGARRFLESIARFASAVPTGMEFLRADEGEREAAGSDGPVPESGLEELVVFTDGASLGNPGPSGAGGVLASPDGDRVDEFSVSLGEGTNNVAEYEAVRIGLERAIALGARRVILRLDSELVANQLTGRYRVKSPGLIEAYLRVSELLGRLDGFEVQAIPREQNAEADRRARTAARTAAPGLGPRGSSRAGGS